MQLANKLELHYYLNDGSHTIDALVRNKCEAEILAIIAEVASVLNVNADIVADAASAGGFREFWKIIGKNSNQITIVLLVAQLMLTLSPMLDSEKDELEKSLMKIQLEEAKLNLEKLRKEVNSNKPSSETAKVAANYLSKNLKVIKRKSNLYTQLNRYQKVTHIGLNVLSDSDSSINDERVVYRSEFKNYMLSTNKLRSEEVEAEIEIISPVLKEGRYKWKGIYNEESISFDMLDLAFKDSVLLDNLPFKHGTCISCLLRISRELDEIGDVKITGYSVTTVIEKIDGDSSYETTQGRLYKHAKSMSDNQGVLFS
ncbi:hypothetical protein ACU5EH_00735 [Aliivibrio salmonicida]|uniref:hypothetical protein n=1 Tax=Aliivibrio salmonicida TaxID=40269 RepID=UPI00406C27EE